jgi:hypothetical protein
MLFVDLGEEEDLKFLRISRTGKAFVGSVLSQNNAQTLVYSFAVLMAIVIYLSCCGTAIARVTV